MTDPADPTSTPPAPLPESIPEKLDDKFYDHAKDHKSLERLGDVAMGAVVPGWSGKVDQILHDMDLEAAADKKMLETEERVMAERPPAEAGGVDIAPIKAVDPAFDDQLFLSVARESFYHVRTARSMDDPRFADAILSPALMGQLKSLMDGDVASHRHHLLPMLEIRNAVITSAAAQDGKLTIVVRYHLTGEELDRDGKMNIIAGAEQLLEWDEDWTYWRDPSVDTTDLDKQHDLAKELEGGWLFAHKGWVVTRIDRVGAPDPLSPANL